MTNVNSLLTRQQMIAAWERRDPQFDGLFVFGVKTTGVVCRPSCPSQPKAENLEFFESVPAAVEAGFRPCKRCQPELANGQSPEWVSRLKARIETTPDEKFSMVQLQELGVPPEKARRWFQKNHGMTFAQWARSVRLGRAFHGLREGEAIDDMVLGNGYESHSGFRTAFEKVFGVPPGKAHRGECVLVSSIESPLGPMLAAVDDRAILELEFSEKARLAKTYDGLRKRFGKPVVPGENNITKQLRGELDSYFAGKLKKFSTPVALHGTDFQNSVWNELLKIPCGETRNYEEIAVRVGLPSGCRAVARANASNRIAVVVPCHRVIAKNGNLSGYAAGVWRKRQLLALEASLKS